MEKSIDAYHLYAMEICNAVKRLYVTPPEKEEGIIGQTLIIMYSAIDSLGFLNAPASQQEANSVDFKNWLREFVLCNLSNDICTATVDDFWSARCGLLHCFSIHSSKTVSGKAKPISYFQGNSELMRKSAIFQTFTHSNQDSFVFLDDLLANFLKGVIAFGETFEKKLESSDKDTYIRRLDSLVSVFTVKA